MELLARFAAAQAFRIGDLAGEIVARCDHALLDDDPASAGDALDRVRALGLALGELARSLAGLSVDEGQGPTDLAQAARDLGLLLDAIRAPGAPPVGVTAGEPVWVDVPRADVVREALRLLVPLASAGLRLSARPGCLVAETVQGESVELPFGTPPLAPAPALAVAAPPPKRRALVAEDNEPLRDLEVLALQPLFDEVLVAADGEEAIAALEAHGGAFDVVLLDLRMPKRNGLEVLHEALTRWPTLRVVVASGAAPAGVAQTAVLTGARAVINKPFRLSELRALVRGVLDGAEW